MFYRKSMLALAAAFGGQSDTPAEPMSLRRVGLGFVFVALALALRRPSGLTDAWFWAEDATVFFSGQLQGDALLWTPYAGYFHFIPRAVAAVGGHLPMAFIPTFYNGAAWVISSICCAWFTLPHFRHLVRSDTLRIAVGVVIALMPSSYECPLTITNVQWYVNVWAGLVVFQRFPRDWSAWVLVTAYGVAVFSAASILVLAPFWLLRALIQHQVRRVALVIFAIHVLFVVAIQLWAIDESPRPPMTAPHTLLGATLEFNVVRVLAYGLLGPLHTQRWFASAPHAAVLLMIAAAAALGFFMYRQRRNLPQLVLAALFLAIGCAAVALGLAFRFGLETRDVLWTHHWSRFFVLPTALFYVWLAVRYEQQATRRGRWFVAISLLPLLLFGILVNLRNTPFDDNLSDKSAWLKRLDEARTGAVRDYLRVPIQPGWHLYVGAPQKSEFAINPNHVADSHQMLRAGASWRMTGDDPQLEFQLPRRSFVESIHVEYELTVSDGAPLAQAQLYWTERARDFSEAERNVKYSLAANGARAQHGVIIKDWVTRLRFDPHMGPGTFRLHKLHVWAIENVVSSPTGQIEK